MLDNGEKLMTLEAYIRQFAERQFVANSISLSAQCVVMKNVLQSFQNFYLQEIFEGSIANKENEELQKEDSIQETVDALNEFYGNDEPDGGMTDG